MKTKHFRILVLFFAVGLMFFSACEQPDPDSQSAEDDARGSYIMADAFAVANNEAGDDGTGKILYPDGMTVERDTIKHTVTITFDNCDFRGRIRNGIIHVAYTRIPTVGLRAVNLTVTFEDYSIDNIKVEGSMITSFGGTYLIPEINVIGTNMKATFPDGKYISWSSNMTYKITEGFGDYDISNNVLEVSGTSSGTNRAGVDYSAIYDKVTVDRACSYGYPISGTVTISSDDKETVIDYGDGDCDDVITVSNNGVSITIHLDS